MGVMKTIRVVQAIRIAQTIRAVQTIQVVQTTRIMQMIRAVLMIRMKKRNPIEPGRIIIFWSFIMRATLRRIPCFTA